MFAIVVAAIIVLAGILFAVTMFMEWIGVTSLFTKPSSPRYQGCGHLKAVPDDAHDRCWHCRHERLEHALHVPGQHPPGTG